MRKIMVLVLALCGLSLAALPPCVKPIPSIDTALVPKVGYVDQNDDEAFDCINEQGDTLRAMLTALGGTTGAVGLSSTGDIKANIDRDSNTTGSRFWVANHTNDTLFRVSDDLAIKAYGAFNVVGASTLAAVTATNGTYSGTLGVTGAVSLASSLTFAAGQDILIGDNSAAALTITQSGNPYLRLVTTDAGEKVSVFKALEAQSTVAVTGNFAVNGGTAAFLVDAASRKVAVKSSAVGSEDFYVGGTTNFTGNSAIGGTLGVTGAQTNAGLTTINSTLTVNSDAASAGSWGLSTITSSSGNGTQSLDNIRDHASNVFRIRMRTAGTPVIGLSIDGGGSVTIPALAGTGTRLTTSTSTGVQGNATTIAGANTWSDKQTHTTAPRFNSVSASEILMSDGSKDLTSVGTSGTGNVVRVTGATLVTPALGIATATRLATSSNTNSVVVTAATDGASSLQVGGSYSEIVESRTSNVTLDLTQSTIEANATGGSFTITLPAAAGCTGRRYTIHKNDASTNTVTVDANASETIAGALTIVLGGNVGNSRLIIKSNGTTWRVEELYEEGTFTAAATGMSACTVGALVGSTCTATAYYTRAGKLIQVYLPDLLGTSSNTSLTVTGLPSFLNATRSQTIGIPAVADNFSNYSGFVILTTGTFTFSFRTTFVDYPSNVFTASGFKGLNSFTFAYTLQ